MIFFLKKVEKLYFAGLYDTEPATKQRSVQKHTNEPKTESSY